MDPCILSGGIHRDGHHCGFVQMQVPESFPCGVEFADTDDMKLAAKWFFCLKFLLVNQLFESVMSTLQIYSAHLRKNGFFHEFHISHPPQFYIRISCQLGAYYCYSLRVLLMVFYSHPYMGRVIKIGQIYRIRRPWNRSMAEWHLLLKASIDSEAPGG